MNRWAPFILIVVAAWLFLLFMGDEDYPFFSAAPQMIFLYSIFRVWLAKYRRPLPMGTVGKTATMIVVIAAIAAGVVFYKQLLTMGTVVGGRILFACALLDVVMEYCGRSKSQACDGAG